MKKLILIFTSICFTAIIQANAQTAMPDTATKSFITNASIGNLNEVVSGQLAAQKGMSPEVKSFGSRMVTDHNKSQAQLLQIVKSKGYQIPPPATGTPMADMMLKEASGKDFDRGYVHMMLPGHRKTVHLFETYAVTGKDPELKAYAQQMLPILKQHLATIKAIDAKIKYYATK